MTISEFIAGIFGGMLGVFTYCTVKWIIIKIIDYFLFYRNKGFCLKSPENYFVRCYECSELAKVIFICETNSFKVIQNHKPYCSFYSPKVMPVSEINDQPQ